jgi:hypothetical protein
MIKKAALLFLVFVVLVQTAQADKLLVTGATCDISLDARYGDAKAKEKTVTLTLKNTGNASMTVYAPSLRVSESGINLTKVTSFPITIASGATKSVQIKVRVAGTVSEGTYSATADFSYGSGTITINVDRLVPAHLASLQNIKIDDPVVFNKPRKEMEKTGFKVEKTFQIVNDGDTSMTLGSVAAYGNPDAGMTFSVNNPSTISEQSAGTATLTITIPVSAPEGEHHGKLRIDAGKAGSQTITVSVVVKHEVKFEMSSYNPDFGRVDVLKSVPLEITLSEALGYKDITSVKIVRDESQPGDGKDDWMSVNLPASTIPKGSSVALTFTLRFRGETVVGRTYSWRHLLTHSAGNGTIALKATATPIDIAATKDALQTIQGSGSPDASNIAGKALGMLSASAESAEQWASVASVSQASVTFLDAMDQAVRKTGAGDHGAATNDLLVAGIAVDTMQKSAKTQAQTNVYKMSDDAEDDRTKIIAYRHAAITYELLNSPDQCNAAQELAAESVSSYNQKIESANNHRVDAEDAIRCASEDLYQWGDVKLLVNPFAYDGTSDGYRFAVNRTETAANEYRAAGEQELYNASSSRADQLNNHWLFLLGQFCMLMIGYILLFVGAVVWCVFAFMAFAADSREEEFGDVVLLS